ncbi:O-methyltransferase lepI [Lachnellula suecica]|uniref:O-methyltransferase lepI n=1 Tax=Lachnellula suecica TaxID=602035 RepID=A0A8T9CBB1_9HELO|nr:O-methyltransferase lepI [Lachnellula suecica]
MSSNHTATTAVGKGLSPIEHLQHVSQAITDRNNILDDATRKTVLEIAKKLVTSLETSQETVMRYAWEFGPQRMSLRVGIDLRLFHLLVESNGKPLSAAELAEKSNAEELLVVRLMRVLCSIGFAAEAGEQSYVATDLTRAITKPSLEAALKVW